MGVWPKMRLLKENPLVQFSVISFVVMAVIAAAFIIFLSNTIQSRAMDALTEEAIADSSGRLLGAITPADLEVPMTAERYDRFHRFVQESIVSERTAQVKLWAKDGTVIYSSDRGSVGEKFPDNENLRSALRGENAAHIITPEEREHEYEKHQGTLIEVYTPIIFPDDTEPQGALEIYQYYQPTAQLISDLQREVLLSTMVVFLFLYGILVTSNAKLSTYIHSSMNVKALKIITIVAPATFIGLIEVLRHSVIIEPSPMFIGNAAIIGVVLIGAFFFSRFIFGMVEKAQSETLRRNQELAALNSVGLAVSESLNLDVVLYRALTKVLQVTYADAGEIFLRDEKTQEMARWVSTGDSNGDSSLKEEDTIGENLTRAVVQSKESLTIDDTSNRSALTEGGEIQSRYRSLASVPLKSKNEIIGVVNIFSLQPRRFTSEDTLLLANMGNQITLAIENARLHDKVQSMATIEERERIAREMHDGLAQVLTYVNAKSQAARQFISSGQETNAKKQLIELEDIAKDMYADVREAIMDLRTTTSPHRDITSTLQEYVLRFSEMSGTKTDLTISNGNIPNLSPNAEVQVIRIIQEALTNVRKHARASHAQVRISTEDSKCSIVIEDNGLGFDVQDIRRDLWPQFGLQTMKERAQSIEGTLDISSSPGSGTRVILNIPIR